MGKAGGSKSRFWKNRRGIWARRSWVGCFNFGVQSSLGAQGCPSCRGECEQAQALPYPSAGEQIPPRTLKIPTPSTPQGSFPSQEISRTRKEPGKCAGLGFCSSQAKPWRNKPPRRTSRARHTNHPRCLPKNHPKTFGSWISSPNPLVSEFPERFKHIFSSALRL